jgi:hypothetical protein
MRLMFKVTIWLHIVAGLTRLLTLTFKAHLGSILDSKSTLLHSHVWPYSVHIACRALRALCISQVTLDHRVGRETDKVGQ